jgi:DNA-damage-inducible protein J
LHSHHSSFPRVHGIDPLVPNEENIAAMKESRKGGLRSFSSVKSLMDDLNAAD